LSEGSAGVVAEAIETLRSEEGALLPILHAVQDRLGYVPRESVAVIAKGLHLSRAEVHGVVTFYHHFRHAPPGRRVMRVCRAEACQAVGANELVEHACRSLGVGLGETTPDGEVTLEAVYCLGNCACGPSVMVGEELHGRVTPERFDALAAGEEL